jgi:hypothetical protein
MASSAAIVLNDHSSAVGQYFGSIRIPAAFIAGASFSGIFQLPPKVGEIPTKIDSFLTTAYSVSITLSFMLAINTIMLATAAGVKQLAGEYDRAASAYQLLNSAYQFEFVLCRWSFPVSLFLFIFAVMNRMLLEFKLLTSEGAVTKVRNREVGLALCLLMSSLVFHLLSYINSTLFCWNNFLELTWDVVKVRDCV